MEQPPIQDPSISERLQQLTDYETSLADDERGFLHSKVASLQQHAINTKNPDSLSNLCLQPFISDLAASNFSNTEALIELYLEEYKKFVELAESTLGIHPLGLSPQDVMR